MAQFFWIPWRLPKLNELLDQRGRVFRKSSGTKRVTRSGKPVSAQANGYSVMKKEWESCIALLARSRGFSVLPGCWDFTYLFVESDTEFDPSNISAAAIKFIEDALVKDKRMAGDGWATVHSIASHFTCTDGQLPIPGVLVAVDNKTTEREALIEQAGRMIHAERIHRRDRSRAATAQGAVRRELPSGNQPLGEAPAGAPETPGARVRAQRAAQDGRGSAGHDSGER